MNGKKAAYQVREPLEDDDERLAMRHSDMLPPVPQRVANPKIRQDRAAQDSRQNSENMHRATSENAHTKAFDYCRRIFITIREEGKPRR